MSSNGNARLRSNEISKPVLASARRLPVRACFGRFQMEALEIEYTVGTASTRSARRELIIYSWDRDAEPAGLF